MTPQPQVVPGAPPVPPSTLVRAAAGLARGVLHPRRPSARELASVVLLGGMPRPRTRVRLTALPQVPRHVPSLVVEGHSGPRLPIALRTFVLEHPSARLLVEPAVATQLHRRVLSTLPLAYRVAVTPPPDTLSTVESLHEAGVDPTSLDLALATHLHWDHVSGLLDLPALELWVHAAERDWATSGPGGPYGVRPALRDRPTRLFDLDGPPVLTFPRSHDLFGDGSVVAVDLAGHTPGSVGLLLATDDGPLLLAGDAAWHHAQVEQVAHKAAYPGLLVDDDREATWTTLLRLHAVRHRVRILPTHDHDRAAACCPG